MISTPIVQSREAKPYVAIRSRVNMNAIPALLPPMIPRVEEWLKQHNIAADGVSFFRYLAMHPDNELDVEVGVPVKEPVEGEGEIIRGSFPAGNYAVVTYTGDYKHLKDVHMFLDSWIKENGLAEHYRRVKIIQGGVQEPNRISRIRM